MASMFSGAGYVDQDYTRTVIGERAQLVKISSDRFKYPEGYFAYMKQMDVGTTTVLRGTQPVFDPLAPKIISEYKPEPEERQPAKPKITIAPKPVSVAKQSPQPSASPAAPTTTAAVANNAIGKSASEQEAEQKLQQLFNDAQMPRPKTINSKPFKDMLANVKQMREKGELDLKSKAEITVEADRAENGKLSNVQVTRKAGDPKLAEIAKGFIAALSDSNALEFLVGVEHLRLTVNFSETVVTAKAVTDMKSDDDANKRAQVYATALVGAILKAKFQKKDDEAALYKSTKVTAKGKQVSLDFNMPESDFSAMLTKNAASP
jgi:hypothetical protein